MKLFLLLALAAVAVHSKQGFGPTDQEWGFVTVRESVDMFWWLHKTTAEVSSPTEKPILIWLQGGPGSASSGYGNFAELGPLDWDLNPRNTSWVHKANVLFVDNPVGTGFSVIRDGDWKKFATTNRQIAEDFLVLLKGFYKAQPDFIKTPLYILCESYGGKMTAEIALVLDQAIKTGEIDCNFKGIGLGDSWISPIDSVMTWGPYLLQFGALDQNGYETVMEAAESTKKVLDEGRFEEATNYWSMTEGIVSSQTNGVDFYNVLKKIPLWFKGKSVGLAKPAVHLEDEIDDKIDELMTGPVAEALGIDVKWGEQGGIVFQQLSEDFMKPVTHIVEELLNTTDIKVYVYNGQLDLIVDTPGTVAWVDRLQWKGSDKFKQAIRSTIGADYIEGYVKRSGNFAFFWVDRAGHMVPADNPTAMELILEDLTDNFKV